MRDKHECVPTGNQSLKKCKKSEGRRKNVSQGRKKRRRKNVQNWHRKKPGNLIVRHLTKCEFVAVSYFSVFLNFRDREERISALNAAKQAEKEELQRKIQQKQEDSARRHEENMEQIRQKAIELSVPRTQEENAVPATVRVCTLCKVSLPSEVQELTHLRGRAHIDAVKKAENLNNVTPIALENFGLKYVCDLQTDKIDFKVQLDKNRFKVLKKHCKKLMQKLVDR